MTLSIMKPCHNAEWHCAECRNLFIVGLNVIMQSVVAPAECILAVSFGRVSLSLVSLRRMSWQQITALTLLKYNLFCRSSIYSFGWDGSP
jgi:hypothetical protein